MAKIKLIKYCNHCGEYFGYILTDNNNDDELAQMFLEANNKLKQRVDKCKCHRTELKSMIEGSFKVVGVDTFSNEDCSIGIYKTLEEALKIAEKESGNMFKTYVYDFNGKEVSGGFGTF